MAGPRSNSQPLDQQSDSLLIVLHGLVTCLCSLADKIECNMIENAEKVFSLNVTQIINMNLLPLTDHLKTIKPVKYNLHTLNERKRTKRHLNI